MDFTTLKNAIEDTRNNTYSDSDPDSDFDVRTREALDTMRELVVTLEKEQDKLKVVAMLESSSIYIEILKLLAGGQKITAIKRMREITGWGLKEAKDFTDKIDKAGRVGAWHRIDEKYLPSTAAFYGQLIERLRNQGFQAAIQFVRFARPLFSYTDAKAFVEAFAHEADMNHYLHA